MSKRAFLSAIVSFFGRLRAAAPPPSLPPAAPGPGEGRARPDPPDAADLPEAYVVTNDLDLHGFFPEQVAEILDEFLRNAEELGYREVRIAHGKGKSVLRRIVWERLERHPLVADFREAPPDRGGWGATIARLAEPPRGTKKSGGADNA